MLTALADFIAYAFFVGGGIFAAIAIEDITRERFCELAVGLVFSAPGFAYTSGRIYGRMDSPTARDANALRTSLLIQIAVTVGATTNAALAFSARSLETVRFPPHEVIVAMFFVLIPCLFIATYFSWRRYREAVTLGASATS